MNTLSKILLATALSGTAISYAGTSPQSNRPLAETATAIKSARPVARPEGLGLMCSRMLVPRVGATKQSPFTVVTCTPETMKNDWRCQQACAIAKKG